MKTEQAVNTDGMTPAGRLPHSSIVHRDRQQDSAHQHIGSQPQRQQQHGRLGQGEQLQQHLQTQLLLHQQSLHQQFQHQYYLKDEIGHLDTVFYAIHLAMSAVHKRVLVTAREQLGFECAMAIFAGALLLRLFFKPLYTRIRPQLVFIVHLLLTIIRASVVYTMAWQQSVHARPNMWVSNTQTVGVLLSTMLAILGGPFRLFEMMGLQQPWQHHMLNSILYMVVHPWAAATGIRLAFSNVMFYQVHAVHDAVSAVLDTLLDAVAGMPSGQQQTCSSCAGIVIYGFMCMFGSVAVPLYWAWAWEQRAQQRWMQQVAPSDSSSSGDSSDGSTRPTADSGPPLQPSSGMEHSHQHAVQVSRPAPAMHPAGSSSSLDSNSDGSGSSSGVMTRLEAICLRAEAVASKQEWGFGKQLPTLSDLVLHANFCTRWCAHLTVLFVLALLCWLVSNGVALVLLPKLLDSRQLQRWCPNRPYTPYLIAGEVYAAL